MTFRFVAQAKWHAHVNRVNPPHALRHWLTGTGSLTVKLKASSAHFRVQRLHQVHNTCLPDECAMVGLARPMLVQEREVLLHCDGTPMVFGHTIVPLQAAAADWPFFRSLGERSLGTTLFGDPQVTRGDLQYARIRPHHPLARRASAALGGAVFEEPLFARRCLYRRHSGLLLVTEVFLPAIAILGRRPMTPALINMYQPLSSEAINESIFRRVR